METNYYLIYYIRLLDCFPSVSKHHYLYYCIYSWRHSSTFSICLIVCHRQRFTCYVHKILDYAPNEMMNNKYYIWLTSKLDIKKISSEEKKQSMVFINIEFSVCPLCHTPTHPQIQNTRMRRQQEESAWGQSNVTYFHSACVSLRAKRNSLAYGIWLNDGETQLSQHRHVPYQPADPHTHFLMERKNCSHRSGR